MKDNTYFIGNLKKKNYFEGWYFKQVLSDGKVLSLIPGISITNHKKEAFIQVIETISNKSYYIPYKIEDVEFSKTDFYIKIKNNYFSKDKIIIDINNQDLVLNGELKFTNLTPLSKTIYRPTIMGPFSYLKHMQCNHTIISMHHLVSGNIYLNNKKIKVKKGIGYIEKDYGTSFPKKYVWMHSNTSSTTSNASLTLSIANIPLGILSFQGFFCILLLHGKEYYFTTYYHSSVKTNMIANKNQDCFQIILKNQKNILELIINPEEGQKLIAPQKGNMNKIMKENLTSKAKLILKDLKTNKKVYEDQLINVGLEIVK